MTRRIVLAAVALLATALLAFAVPLAVAVRGLLVSRALDGLQAETDQVAVIVDDQARTCGDVELILALASRQQASQMSLFSRQTGRLLATVPGHEPTAGPELESARDGALGRHHGFGRLAVAVPLSTRACGPRLVLHAEQDDAAVVASIRRAWTALAGVGLGVLAVAALAAWTVARRLTRPLEDLADAARRLGEGDFSVRTTRSGLPEADAIAATLDTTAERLGRAVDRGRTFAADASHQLRTPLTALRLRLETLEASGADPDTVRAALAETDRLEATIDELVSLTDVDVSQVVTDLEELVRPCVQAIARVAEASGRRVQLETLPSPMVRVRAGALRQALQVLLDNALHHGAGTIRVTVAPTLPDQPQRGVRVCVTDEGPGLPPAVVEALRARDRGAASLPRRGGRGLPLARVLIEGEGGRLVVGQVETGARVCLVLPPAGVS